MIHPSTRGRVLAPVLSLLLASCGGADEGEAPGLDGPDRPLEWSREVAWQAGGIEATGWDAFGAVGGIGFDDDGNLHILDRQAFRVTVVSPEGEPIRSYGAQGEGPGELNSPAALVVFPDGSSAVQDIAKFGFVTYGPDGTWVDDVTWRDSGTMILFGDMAPAGDRSLFAERTGMFTMGQPGSAGDGDSEPEPPGDPVVRIDLATGEPPEVVFRAWEPPEPEGPESDITLPTAGGGFTVRMDPIRAFTPDLRFAGLRDGRFAVVDSTTYTIEIRDGTGSMVEEISRPITPIPVTEAVQDAERDRRLADLRQQQAEGRGAGAEIVAMGRRGGTRVDASEMNEAQIRRVEDMLFWPEIPVVAGLATDWQNRLWVTRGAEPGEEGPIDILTAAGEYVGTLPAGGMEVPDAFGPNGMAAWIETDEFDVARITVARIVTADPTN